MRSKQSGRSYPLRRLRDRLGETLDQAADAIGITPLTLSRWERGLVDVLDARLAKRIADHYGLSVDELLSQIPTRGRAAHA